MESSFDSIKIDIKYIEKNMQKSNFNSSNYWNKIYQRTDNHKLGWYEEDAEPSFRLILKSQINQQSSILNVGAGSTTLTEKLLNSGYQNIILNDISDAALSNLKQRLPQQSVDKIHWIIDDLTNSTEISQLDPVDLWHDRAVFHFFLTDHDQENYFKLVKKTVKVNGYAILAAFNLDSATKCSGLDIQRYDAQTIQKKLGAEFQLIDSFHHIYTMPSGDTRNYIYTLFQKTN